MILRGKEGGDQYFFLPLNLGRVHTFSIISQVKISVRYQLSTKYLCSARVKKEIREIS